MELDTVFETEGNRGCHYKEYIVKIIFDNPMEIDIKENENDNEENEIKNEENMPNVENKIF